MSFFGSLWNGIKGIGKGIVNAFTGSNGGNYISGLAGLGGSALNYIGSAKGIKDQYHYNQLLQNNAQQWSTGMASTAHQLEVNDLRKAGLNPILSATGGSGASAPSASGGSVGMPDYDLGSGISTALQYRQQKNQNKLADTQSELYKAQKGLVNEQENNAYQEGLNLFDTRDYIRQQTADLKNQIKNRDITTSAQVRRLETMNTADLMNAITNRDVGSANAYYQRHRALGFSSSWSSDDSDSYQNGSLGPTNWFPSKSGSRSSRRSYSYTK